LRPGLALLVWSVVASACGDEDPRDLRWRLVFGDRVSAERARGYEATILTTGCTDTATPVYSSRAAAGESFSSRPPVLQPGTWGFAARAMDGACRWYAQGCSELTLPVKAGTVVEVRLDASPEEEPACTGSERCYDGVCGGPDAGPGEDAGEPDSGLDAGPQPDAGVDAGLDSGVDSGVDSGIDAGVDAGDAGGCPAGFDDCNGLPGDGCEQALNTLNDCGRCDTNCNLGHATESCATGTCEIVDCDQGWDDCDNNTSNGCEGCEGGCPDGACSISGARENCNAGVCEFAGCDNHRADCDVDLGNGCEVNTNEDEGNCGVCDNVCGGGDECQKGECAPGG